jgi:hypothetical protein
MLFGMTTRSLVPINLSGPDLTIGSLARGAQRRCDILRLASAGQTEDDEHLLGARLIEQGFDLGTDARQRGLVFALHGPLVGSCAPLKSRIRSAVVFGSTVTCFSSGAAGGFTFCQSSMIVWAAGEVSAELKPMHRIAKPAPNAKLVLATLPLVFLTEFLSCIGVLLD